MTKNWKNIQLKKTKTTQLTYPEAFRFVWWVTFDLLDPDPETDPLTLLNPDPIRILIRNTGLFFWFFLYNLESLVTTTHSEWELWCECKLVFCNGKKYLPPVRFHCMAEVSKIEPGTVVILALAVEALTTQLDLIHDNIFYHRDFPFNTFF